MNDDIIHRSTDTGGKRPSIWIGETLESRNCTVVTDELVGNHIQLEGRYTRLDMLCQFSNGLTNELVRLAHQLDFVFSLQEYLHRRLVGSHSAAMDAA